MTARSCACRNYRVASGDLASCSRFRAYVARDKADAAERLAMRIVAIIETLRSHPHLGRAGPESGLRELIIGGTPYIVGYMLHGDRVTIATIWRCAQRRQGFLGASFLGAIFGRVSAR